MAKLTKEQREKIKELYEQGVNTYDLAKIFEVSQSSIMYWISSPDRRAELSKQSAAKYKARTPEQKKAKQKREKSYFAEYFKQRYHNEPEFRKKHIERVMKSKERIERREKWKN